MVTDKDGTTYGEIYVPCQQCGHMNTLRQVEDKPKALSHAGMFKADIQEVVKHCSDPHIAPRGVVRQVLNLFCGYGNAKAYRVQIYDDGAWHTITWRQVNAIRQHL